MNRIVEQLALPGIVFDSKRSQGRRRRWTWIAIAAVALVGGGLLLAHRGQAASRQAQPAAPRAVPVVAVRTVARDLGIYLIGLGAVTPLNTVTVHTRVEGELLSVRYRQGQTVSKGELLAEIDPRPFQAQLTQYEGQLARDQALLENAQVDLQRYQTLWSQNSIQKQQVDTQLSLVHQYEGAVKNDQGLIDATRVNLDYCRITSPIDGRVGLRLVDPGNIVRTTDTTGIVVITQLQPITVIFTLPEDNIAAVVERLTRGERLVVEAYDRAQQQKLASGHLMTIDNQIDTTTGTVKLRAEFPNADNRLFPNQFVNARLTLGMAHGATVVPVAAIQRSASGAFVYVVNQHQTAEARPVILGITDGDHVQITKGVAPGDVVVVNGADRLRDGSPIDARIQGS